MNFKNKLTALLVVLLSFGASAEGISFEHISLDEALEKSKAQNKPIFIDIYATWCGPCKYLSREVFIEEELGAYMNDNFINLKINGEEGDGDYLMATFGLDAFPTMLFLSSDKQELNRIVGAVSAEEILSVSKGLIDPTSTKLYEYQTQYEGGDREKEFMQLYISELVQNDQEYEQVVADYLEFYPDLDLYSKNEFLIFCIGVNDINDPKNLFFLENINDFIADFPDLTQAKISILIYSVCEDAFNSGNNEIIDEAVVLLTQPINQFLEETVTEDDLRELMLEALTDM